MRAEIYVRAAAGRALRKLRVARGLTLRQAADASRRRFTPTTIAGYERGERSISLERFVELCYLYRVPPERVLAAIERERRGELGEIVDVTETRPIAPEQRAAVEAVAARVRERRAQRGGPVTLRESDMVVLATASGASTEALLALLAPELTPEPRA